MLDRKGRPLRTADSKPREELFAAIVEAWSFHPEWHLGQLLQKASNITVGTRTAIEFMSDDNLARGLQALVPDEWEIELDGQA